ncbi:hypothetical protein [Microcoleus sp. Z1_B5]|uniref:hypothetical protein n=1 Tax=Microcoleus sp. Z1_B5 TaxID=3055430 RepID=UPI002FD2E21C
MVQTNESAIELRCCTILNYLFMNRQDACSTIKFTLCGTGILSVKREWCKMCDRTHQINVKPNSNKGGQNAHPTY